MARVIGPRYAKSGDFHVAYEVTGTGPVDLLLVPDGMVPIELTTEEPFAHFLHGLARFSRVICFDRRGLGLSDPVSVSTPPTLEQWMDDARAVLDAVGSSRTAAVGIAEGGFVATLLAATHPGRVSALILVNATPNISAPPFSGLGKAAEALHRLARSVDENWGSDTSGAEFFAPSAANDQRFADWLARVERRAASPAVARAVFEVMFYSDIRHILPAVRVPTLVIHRAGNRYITPDHGRYLAEQIPGARYVEVAGDDHVPYLGNTAAILDEIEEFLTGVRRGPEPDRVLATLLLVDIVGSTEHAAELRDQRWRELLERFRALVRRELARFRGREVDTAGDGFLAMFDGPARAIHCARAILTGIAALAIQVRIGIHTGECELLDRGITGIAVHTAARVMGEARPGEVLVSRTVKDLVAGAGIAFSARGTRALKGVPGEWELFAVES